MMKKEFYGENTAYQIISLIWTMKGAILDVAVHDYLDKDAVAPSCDLVMTWGLAEKNSSEHWHKFNLHCDAGRWEAEFSGLYLSSQCSTPQEAILQALLIDKFDIVYDIDKDTWEFGEIMRARNES